MGDTSIQHPFAVTGMRTRLSMVSLNVVGMTVFEFIGSHTRIAMALKIISDTIYYTAFYH